jgi:ABC-type uncharacterized transport system ATPase subunit
VCGVFDFSMKDVLTPDPKRVRRHLSAIINFAKFKEERFAMFTDLANKVRVLKQGERLKCSVCTALLRHS